MKSLFLTLLLVVNVAAATAQPAPTLDMLVADVASGDDGPRQARARQLLPMRGPDAAWKMVPLLDDPRPEVAFTAKRILEDVIHETGYRGGAAEKAGVADAIFALVAPGASDRQRDTGLRLLPYVVTEAHGLDALALLLGEEPWREPARACLENAGTRNALSILCDALNTAEEPFQIDLLRSIAAFEPGGEVTRIAPLLESGSAAVQAVALRTLARTGDPALTVHARRICAAVAPENAFDAWDGWLRLADAMAARGGRWEQAMQSYREILATAPHTLVQGGAIAGMGRYGDAGCIPVIAEALAREGGTVLEPAAMEAFRSLSGKEARLALVAAYPGSSVTMKVSLLGLFGDVYAPEYAAILSEEARHEDPVLRNAARNALARTASTEAVEVFCKVLEQAYVQGLDWNPELEDAVNHLRSLARRLRQAGNGDGAGRAWLAVYRGARDEVARKEALDGIRANPVPEAFDVVLDLLAAGDIESLPVEAMVGIAQNAIQLDAMRKDGTDDRHHHQTYHPGGCGSCYRVMRSRGPRLTRPRNRGCKSLAFCRARLSVKVPGQVIGEPDVRLEDTYTVGGTALQWHAADSTDAAGLFDLFGVIGHVEQAVAFAYARIETPEGGPARYLRVLMTGYVSG